MNYTDESGLRSPFYRVAGKAVVRDDAGRLLVVRDDTGTYELPGGGWEHGEDFETCLRREIQEELGVAVSRIDGLLFTYRGRGHRPHSMLRLAAKVELASHDFVLDEDEVTEARFVDREEFLKLNWCAEDREVLRYIDDLWPPVEKRPENR